MNIESTTTTKHTVENEHYIGVVSNVDGKYSAKIWQKNSNNSMEVNDEKGLCDLLKMIEQINEIWE